MVLLTMPGNVSCVGSVYHCLYIQSPSLNPVGHILNWGKVLSCTAWLLEIQTKVCEDFTMKKGPTKALSIRISSSSSRL